MRLELAPQFATWFLPVDYPEWHSGLPIPAASAIANALESGAAAQDGRTITVCAETVSKWPESTATLLGIPPNSPLAFDVRLTGAMGKPGARVAVRWLQPGRTVPEKEVFVNGLWQEVHGGTYRIASPIFEVLALVEQFNQASGAEIEGQFRLWSRMRELLGEQAASSITDAFLRSFRVVTASHLTFGIAQDARGEVQIDPVLLVGRPARDGEPVDFARALTDADDTLFASRVDQLPSGASAFPLGQGTYVVVDEPLQQALTVVRTLRKKSVEERKRAAMYPEAVIREMLGLGDTEPSVFVETEKFSERVRDVGEWSVPVLPWVKVPTLDWSGPAAGGIRLNGIDIPLDKTQIDAAVTDMQQALSAGSPTIKIGEQAVSATQSNLEALTQLQRALTGKQADGRSVPDKHDSEDRKLILIIETNFSDASFTRTTVGRRPGTAGLPGGLKTSPKPHQETGIAWLQEHWITGSRGALLCDDMGLGKTFQALAFCQWLREQMEQKAIPRRPILIVAPVGLLQNWENEISDHLIAPGLGDVVKVYGDHVKQLKRGRHVDGTAGLDTVQLDRADLVLANYEAISDYQISFGAVRFCAVVFDEAQKIKSPKARMTHAAKALNTDFVIALTGTPVENRFSDLWCIADAVQPGALADLKDFSSRYEKEGADPRTLREIIWQEERELASAAPKMLLRRLKANNLPGLPSKEEHILRYPMPPRQEEAYGRALAIKAVSGPEGTLGMIHALRRISLHPVLAEGGTAASELRVEDSARLKVMIDVLDQIARSGEKALIFLESLDLQDADQLPLLLQRRYGLARLPMVINGQVSTESRQARIASFQKHDGFDVMLLSPKAGGVGFTLTAANHVIHLSRWWNPAVEDQCSDRVYRIGQTRPVHIYYPLAVLADPESAESSFDVQLQTLMDRKRQLARNLLVAPAFTKSDYDELVSGTLAGKGH